MVKQKFIYSCLDQKAKWTSSQLTQLSFIKKNTINLFYNKVLHVLIYDNTTIKLIYYNNTLKNIFHITFLNIFF